MARKETAASRSVLHPPIKGLAAISQGAAGPTAGTGSAPKPVLPQRAAAPDLADAARILLLPPSLREASDAEQRRYYEELVTRHEDILARARASLATTSDRAPNVRERLQQDQALIYVRRAEQQLALLRTRVDELSE